MASVDSPTVEYSSGDVEKLGQSEELVKHEKGGSTSSDAMSEYTEFTILNMSWRARNERVSGCCLHEGHDQDDNVDLEHEL